MKVKENQLLVLIP